MLSCIALSLNSGAQDAKKIKYIDTSLIDYTLKPGDDFYKYANSKWIKNNPIPSNKTRWGSFIILSEETSLKLKSLLETAAANPSKSKVYQMVGDFYASAMDSAAIEKTGISPIQNELASINNINSLKEVIDAITTFRVKGIASPLFGFYVGQDSKNVNNYIPQLGQGGTTLPDRDYYLKNDARSANIRKEYKSYISDLFMLTGVDSNTARGYSEDILNLEIKLANAQWSRVEMRDPQRLYNKYAIPDFASITPHLNWKEMFSQLLVTAGQDSIIVSNPKFMHFADSLLYATPISTWKTYLKWYVIKNATPYLKNDFVQRSFKFNKVLSGQKEITPRWQRMSNLIDGDLGDLLGQMYVEKYFRPEAKERMLLLVNTLQKTFENRIRNVDWMSQNTKDKAILKLRAFTKKIGYTDKWKTYDGIKITRDNLLENIRNCNVWSYNDMVSRLGKPIDKSEWAYTPPTINAGYNSVRNEISFPAGILQFPFFDFGADDAVNYGGIGTVIGHEMTHGFDDKGRQYDADGNLKDWWTEEDAKQFKSKAEKIVNEYDQFVVLDTLHVNGKLTQGENMADLGGINIAYEAFKQTPQGKSNTLIDGLTPDQRFFLSFAQIWRGNSLPETAAQMILVDPHSPGEFRTNGVVFNLAAFYKAFNIQPGDKMYKPESERIKIW